MSRLITVCHGMVAAAHQKNREKTNQFMDNKDAAANVHDSSIC